MSRLFFQTLVLTASGISLSLLPATMVQPSYALTGAEVNQVAEKVTVFIQGVDNDSSFGSGVIIQRSGQIYTVLTTGHVLESSAHHTITTPDNFQHRVQRIQRIPNVDLATFQFESDNEYSVAQQGNSDSVTPTSKVYVTGFPKPGFNISIPTYTITNGNITTVLRRGIRNGYGLAYTNPTRAGMSGGPVFNEDAEIIAIHGRKEGEIDGSAPPGAWLNLGIPINYVQRSYSALRPSSQPSVERPSIGGGDLRPAASEEKNIPVVQRPTEQVTSPKQPALIAINQTTIPASLLVPFPNEPQLRPNESASKGPETTERCNVKNGNGIVRQDCQMVLDLSAFQQQLQEAAQPSSSAQPSSTSDVSETWIGKGNENLRRQDYSQAIASFSSAIRQEPNNGVPYFNRAIAYYYLGNKLQAYDNFKSASELFQLANDLNKLAKVTEILNLFQASS